MLVETRKLQNLRCHPEQRVRSSWRPDEESKDLYRGKEIPANHRLTAQHNKTPGIAGGRRDPSTPPCAPRPGWKAEKKPKKKEIPANHRLTAQHNKTPGIAGGRRDPSTPRCARRSG